MARRGTAGGGCRRVPVGLAALAAAWLGGMGLGAAATITVTTAADEDFANGVCSLREAVRAAVTDAAYRGCPAGSLVDTIVVPAGTYNLTLGEIVISGNTQILNIDGVSPLRTVLRCGSGSRLFRLEGNSGPVELRDLQLTYCFLPVNGNGGAVNVNASDLRLTSCLVTSNQADRGGGVYLQYGSLRVEGCAFVDNYADTGEMVASDGGAIYAFMATTLEVNNSTFSGNNASGSGGAIWAYGSSGLEMRNTTVTDNGCCWKGGSGGGGIWLYIGVTPLLSHSIVADNLDLGFAAPDIVCGGTAVPSYGHNLVGVVDDCDLVAATGDHFGSQASPLDPLLGPLWLNGGSTFSHQPQPGSLAFEGGSTSVGYGFTQCLPADQRGRARAHDGDANGTAECEIGAVEAVSVFEDGFELGWVDWSTSVGKR